MASDKPPLGDPASFLRDLGPVLGAGDIAALLERHRSGKGQVVDTSILEGVASLATATMGMRNAGLWRARGENAFDGSRRWYRIYETADSCYVAVGAIEPRFYEALLDGLGLDPADWPRAPLRSSRWRCVSSTSSPLRISSPTSKWPRRIVPSWLP